MRLLALILITSCLTLLLIFVLFVPVVRSPGGGTMSVCGPHGCINNIIQYESISYAYGGWGAFFQTGVNWYAVQGWMCMEGACVVPYYAAVWSVVSALLLADYLSFLVIVIRRSSVPELPASHVS